MATHVSVGEMLDTAEITSFTDSLIEHNSLMTYDSLITENQTCSNLCFIPTDYLDFYLGQKTRVISNGAEEDTMFKLTKAELLIDDNSIL